MAKINIDQFLEEAQFQNEETTLYINKETAEIFLVEDKYFFRAQNFLDAYGTENPIEYTFRSDWERDNFELALKIIQNTKNKYIKGPSQTDLQEYKIMKSFATELDDHTLKTELLKAIKYAGAFKRFKDIIKDHYLLDKWYKYRDDLIKAYIISWCKKMNLDFE